MVSEPEEFLSRLEQKFQGSSSFHMYENFHISKFVDKIDIFNLLWTCFILFILFQGQSQLQRVGKQQKFNKLFQKHLGIKFSDVAGLKD